MKTKGSYGLLFNLGFGRVGLTNFLKFNGNFEKFLRNIWLATLWEQSRIHHWCWWKFQNREKGKTPFYLNVEVNRDPHAVERFAFHAKSHPGKFNISPFTWLKLPCATLIVNCQLKSYLLSKQITLHISLCARYLAAALVAGRLNYKSATMPCVFTDHFSLSYSNLY